jgi:hypothetical protein
MQGKAAMLPFFAMFSPLFAVFSEFNNSNWGLWIDITEFGLELFGFKEKNGTCNNLEGEGLDTICFK